MTGRQKERVDSDVVDQLDLRLLGLDHDLAIADVDDETNASIALTCREVAGDASVVAFAEDPEFGEDASALFNLLTSCTMVYQANRTKIKRLAKFALWNIKHFSRRLKIFVFRVDASIN